MNTSKIFSILLFLMLGISLLLIVLLFTGEMMKGDEPKFLNLAINWAIALVIITAAAAILTQLLQMIFISGNLIKTLIIIVLFAILVIVSYTLASDELLDLAGYTGTDNVPKTLKLTDMGLYLMYFIFGTALLSILVTEVLRPFKK